MVRAAALAACLLALVAGAAAGTCTKSYIRLEYLSPRQNPDAAPDPMASCLNSVRLDLDNIDYEGQTVCAVRLTSLSSNGNFQPAIWSAADGLKLDSDPLTTEPIFQSQQMYTECPSVTRGVGPAGEPVGSANAEWVPTEVGTGTHLEAVRRAIIKAFASFNYGLDEDLQYNNVLEVPDLDFQPGRLVVKRTNAWNLIYIVTSTDVTLDDVRQDDDISAIYEADGCSVTAGQFPYEAASQCLTNEAAHDPCPANTYGVMVVEDGAVNAYNEKLAAFKLCALCPPGTASSDGYGCTACEAGQFSTLGQDCQDCPAGTYSPAGSAYCVPCPTGTYSDAIKSPICKQCPEDTYAWIPGSSACLRCINGLPANCLDPNNCLVDQTDDGTTTNKPHSTEATHIVEFSALTTNYNGASTGACSLTSAVPDYEIKAFTKCSTWANGGSLKAAFTIYGDCSIQISPISDPTCADPTDGNTTYPYGSIQTRAYYTIDNLGNYAIRSLFPTNQGVTKATMLSIDVDIASDTILARWFPVTTDANEAMTNRYIKDNPGTGLTAAGLNKDPEVCQSTVSVLGGSVLFKNGPNFENAIVQPWTGNSKIDATIAPLWTCPEGSYWDAELVCPICPVGFKCGGGSKGPQTKIACDPNTYNPYLGYNSCEACPDGTPTTGTYTSYAANQQCDVARVDLLCAEKDAADPGKSWYYDLAAQECLPCPAGTARSDYTVDAKCEPCPAGQYSSEGGRCTNCPPGQYSPSQGLADQTDNLGTVCLKCALGSIPLKSDQSNWDTQPVDDIVDPTTYPGGAGPDATIVEGADMCDACPPGSYGPNQDTLEYTTTACIRCGANTYRAGDATPENNVCKPIPAGYKLAAGAGRTQIALCDKGQVSFYSDGLQDTINTRIPTDDATCLSCAGLDDALGLDNSTPALAKKWAHTFAPRKGMTQCIPCPGGTIPDEKDLGYGLQTSNCKACGNGSFRDAYNVSSTCFLCGAGREVGPSSKMDCTMCRPGTYMDNTRATTTSSVNSNTCADCEKNFYRPTFGATSCLPCPRGTQTSNTGNVECTACPIGYFNNQVGTTCKPAPVGTFVNTTGAFVTTPCPKGSWNNEQANDNCNPCAPGKYSNTLGAKECKTCPAGTYSAGQATACIDCRKGYHAPAGAASCSPCKPGTYAPDTKSATCKLCPKGYQCPTNAMSKEGPCPRGTFSNKEGNRLCTPCPVNTISGGGGTAANPVAVMACVKCPPGSNTRGLVGQSRCQVIRPQVKRLF